MIRLAVRCRAADADRVLAELLELNPNGVEEERGPEWAELAVYGVAGELPALPDLEAAVGAGMVEISSTEIPDDWADRWRDFHRPVAIAGGRLVVRPSWEEARHAWDPAAPGAEGEAAGIDLVIDPGQAFGTGAHATTRMCLELLLALADAGEARGPFADLGTGSGVLAIAAAKLGWEPVTGFDSEAAALETAGANASANGVELELERVNLRERAAPVAATLTANLTAALLTAVAERLDDPPATLVCSGLLRGEAEQIAAAFGAAGLRQAERRTSGDWVALLLQR